MLPRLLIRRCGHLSLEVHYELILTTSSPPHARAPSLRFAPLGVSARPSLPFPNDIQPGSYSVGDARNACRLVEARDAPDANRKQTGASYPLIRKHAVVSGGSDQLTTRRADRRSRAMRSSRPAS